MFHNIMSHLYELPYSFYIFSAVFMILLWSGISFSMRRHLFLRQRINALCVIILVVFVMTVTIFIRSRGNGELYLVPFSSLERALHSHDIYKQIALNVLLFVPLGVVLPFALESTKRPVINSVCFLLMFSLMIETIQFALSIGCAEIDDVICNCLGGLIGLITYPVVNLLTTITEKKKEKI